MPNFYDSKKSDGAGSRDTAGIRSMRHLIPLLLATSVAAAEQTDGPAKQGSTPVTAMC